MKHDSKTGSRRPIGATPIAGVNARQVDVPAWERECAARTLGQQRQQYSPPGGKQCQTLESGPSGRWRTSPVKF